MANKARPERSHDFRAGLVCAEAFQRLAEPFVSRIARDVKEGLQNPSSDLGDLVACAANLAFALELYIKTLLAQLAMPVPSHHHLRQLYDALPQEIRADIGKAYDALRSQWHGKRAAVTIAKGPTDSPSWGEYRNVPMDLESLLERSSDLFQTWRYIYEVTIPEDSQYQFHQFEYGPLLCACDAVKAACTKRLAKNG